MVRWKTFNTSIDLPLNVCFSRKNLGSAKAARMRFQKQFAVLSEFLHFNNVSFKYSKITGLLTALAIFSIGFF